jgi:hypothetical protein
MNTQQTTIEFLSAALAASDMGGSRGRLDMFADRLVKAASEPTLPAALEHLLRAVHASADSIHPPLATQMIGIASSSDGPRVLRWWREQAKLVTMLAGTRDQQLVADTLAAIELPAAQISGVAIDRGTFPISLVATCLSPLSHGDDKKAGNATLFRRQDVLCRDSNDCMRLPFYSGNAIRGQMRDLLADHFLQSIGLMPDRARPVVALWFFYALYCGGNLEENSDATKALKKQLGDNGAIRATGIGEFRQMIPFLSILGCALGNRTLPGHLNPADLRPRCIEYGSGERSVCEMMTWEYLTRREDHEDHLVHHGMIATTELLRSGAILDGGLDPHDATPTIELAALGRGLQLLAKNGYLGGGNRMGFGKVRIEINGLPDPSPYDTFLDERKDDILKYLQSVGALADLVS